MIDPLPTALAETIATYDVIAHRYAVRFAVSDLADLRAAFCAQVGRSGPRGALVLDAGCGPGLGCRRLAASGVAPIGLDLSEGMLREAATITRAPLIRSDLGALPLADGRLAGIWCNAALVHLSPVTMGLALHEFARATRPGGVLFASIGLGDGDEWHTGPSGRRRWFQSYDRTSFLDAADNAHFEPIRADTHDDGDGPWLSLLARRR